MDSSPSSSQSNSRELSQRAIDAEIESLKESIRALKCRRNALSPISSLPPEVFAAIFSILCLPGTSSRGGKSDDHHLARFCISQVCHQWREMALNQPLLWSHVDFGTLSSAASAAKILARAKSAPLCFKLDASPWDESFDIRLSTFRKQLQARMPHIRQLRINAGPVLLSNILKEIVSPAPTLEYLSLSSHRAHGVYPIREHTFITEALFNGSTPRLSCLKLCNCNVSWKSQLLKGLKYLEIITPATNKKPELAVWLDALDEMPELRTLTLHSASPNAEPFPFNVERTATLSSLTCLEIFASPWDCALALAHLDLPALDWLCLKAITHQPPNTIAVQHLLTYVEPHAHGPQDTQPLQSAVICCEYNHADILAWPVPNIGIGVHESPTTALPSTRVALSFWSSIRINSIDDLEILNTMLAGLPLNGLVTIVSRFQNCNHERYLTTQRIWLGLSQRWPLLQRVRLTPLSARGFIMMLLEDSRGRDRPLLPSLTELAMVDFSSDALSLLPLCKALMKRMEQGVPVKVLDLRMCDLPPDGCPENWFRSLTEIQVDVLVLEKTCEAREKMKCMWNAVTRGEGEYSEV